MAKVINNPETLIKNIARKLHMGFKEETYDPKKTIGSQIREPGYLQQKFWKGFAEAFSDRFAGEIYDTQKLWAILLDQEINPFHLEFLITNKSYSRNEKIAKMVMLKNPLEDYSAPGAVSPVGYIRQWDELLTRSLNFSAPYEVDREVISPLYFRPMSRFMAHVLQAEHPALFIYASERYDAFVNDWVDWLPNVTSNVRVEASKRLIETICDTGIKRPEKTARAMGRMGPALTKAAQLLQKLTFEEDLDAGYVSTNLSTAMRLHFPEPMDRVQIAKDLMKIGLPEVTEGALNSLFLEPEFAVEALSSIEPEVALAAFGEQLRSSIGIRHYNMVDSLPKLIALVETYRELFIQYGMGEIKGHSCLDGLCTSLEAAQYFAEKGYIREAPALDFCLSMIKVCAFTDRLQPMPESDWPLKESEVDQVLDVLVKLKAVDQLSPSIEAYFKNGTVRTQFMKENVFEHLVVRLIERNLCDVNEMIRTELRLKKVQSLGVNPRCLEGVKWFDKNVEGFFARDLGL
jgi:hypothetical protein